MLEDKIKTITLKNLKKAYKFIIVKDKDKYYLYSDLKSHHKDMFENFKKIANNEDFECKGGGMVLYLKKELMLYGTSKFYRKFPKDIAKELILDYVKDSEFEDCEIVVK